MSLTRILIKAKQRHFTSVHIFDCKRQPMHLTQQSHHRRHLLLPQRSMTSSTSHITFGKGNALPWQNVSCKTSSPKQRLGAARSCSIRSIRTTLWSHGARSNIQRHLWPLLVAFSLLKGCSLSLWVTSAANASPDGHVGTDFVSRLTLWNK